MGGCVALITYIQRLRSNKIESVARSLALPFRRKPTDQDKALIVGCNLEGTSIQNVSNVVEAARTEELNLTLFDYEYAYVGGSSAKRYQTISRVQSSGLKLPSFMMFPKTMYSKIGGGSSDISFPEAIEFNKKYILRAGDEAGIRAIFTSDLLHFIGQQEHLTIEGFGDLVFVYRAGRRPKPRDFAASIAEAKHILALLLEGQRSRSPTEETAS